MLQIEWKGEKKLTSLVLPEGGKINMCQDKNKEYSDLCQEAGLRRKPLAGTHYFSP
jgi:hypothetical protein